MARIEIRVSDNIAWKKSEGGKIKLSYDPMDNFINIDGLDYKMEYLDEYQSSKGGNSSVFQLVNPDVEDEVELIIKICNKPLEESNWKYKRRFDREIVALGKAKAAKKKNIIRISSNGIVVINKRSFPFYTMEVADYDLARFLRNNEVDVSQKLLICLSVLSGFEQLHELKIYHRDIKHDNIFLLSQECKLGDLGLMRFKEDDINFIKSEIGDRIGAFGWESPETINKYLTEKHDDLDFDCELDELSDIFQLGKLFWYIFQGNLPIGQISFEDFNVDDQRIFDLIFSMLRHSKPSRVPNSIGEISNQMRSISKEYQIT